MLVLTETFGAFAAGFLDEIAGVIQMLLVDVAERVTQRLQPSERGLFHDGLAERRHQFGFANDGSHSSTNSWNGEMISSS